MLCPLPQSGRTAAEGHNGGSRSPGSDQARRLLRRLTLAGRASLGAAAAAALLETDEQEAGPLLSALSRAGLIDHVRASRYRLHDVVRAFAQGRLLDEEATALFVSYDDRRGADWSRFLRCTLLPYASAGGIEVGSVVAEQELSDLTGARHEARDGRLEDCVSASAVMLGRGVALEDGWQAWQLGMVPNRHAREVMGVPVEATRG